MNWIKTPPTKAGDYRWRERDTDSDWWLLRVSLCRDGSLRILGHAPRFAFDTHPSQIGGEWQGPLVPVEEVEKAWHEAAAGGPGYLWARYRNSRACKIVEGA